MKPSFPNLVVASVAIIYLILASVFLIQYSLYLSKPGDGTWENTKRFLQDSAHPGEPLVFEPDWLKNYATDYSRFRAFNLTGCVDVCPSYWLISLSNGSIPAGHKTD